MAAQQFLLDVSHPGSTVLIVPVVLSGGVGSRLWPLSREAHPKPFIKLDDGQSLLQKTYQRVASVSNANEVITVTNRELFFYTKDEFEATENRAAQNTFLLEPVGRNSAMAIAVAAQYALAQHGSDCTLLIMPADHLIDDVVAFSHAVRRAEALASQGKLVTFGIKPTSPKTGFGYIEADGHEVRRFVEKPDRQTAEEYLASGKFFWNSGIFCMRAGSFLTELSLFAPDIADQAFKCVSGAKRSSGEGWQQYEMQQADFEQIRSVSVDYAVFEKSQHVAVVPCELGWSDIGSWTEYGALHPSDQHHNNVTGNVMLKQTNNCIVQGGDRLIATLGISDLIIADTSDALLVAHKNCTQDVRTIVDELKSRNDPSYKSFSTVHRPWGTYTVLQEGPRFKLKRIEVKSGGRLSLQSHKHRSEHWIVVSGNALVTNADELIELSPNQSTYIPLGNKHRLENPGFNRLILIEVQCGDYLGEDDIIRYEDAYGR
ncbi:MAG: mannose-1-phosphate guanylyltransferase/mannose-6-phosphate isomerase [Endozoicomonadaceae bacterium]|nr:mannose-1-phosphate guanylyltransferase/mannose-6-phosphate isomerase [Endozoicomonadaceae bacterium]